MGTMADAFKNANSRHKREVENAISKGYDLIKFANNGSCCYECALRRNRVYSISGTDNRFPKYSEYNCSCYGISIVPFNEGTSQRWYPDYDYVKESNRPLTDNRTDEEKMRHKYDCDRVVYEELLERDRLLYKKMETIIPDFPFKSFRSYRAASQEKITEFSKTAKKYGFDILPTEEEEKAVERYIKIKKEKGWR